MARLISFEEIILAIEANWIDLIEHPNCRKYSNQPIYVVKLDDYIYLVLLVTGDDQQFLLIVKQDRNI